MEGYERRRRKEKIGKGWKERRGKKIYRKGVGKDWEEMLEGEAMQKRKGKVRGRDRDFTWPGLSLPVCVGAKPELSSSPRDEDADAARQT